MQLFLRRDQALFMSTLAWLESTLNRSARLGLQVLERASRRRMYWMNPLESSTPDTPDTTDITEDEKEEQVNLEEAFAAITEFMTQTSYHCKKHYQVAGGKSSIEKKHVHRFHKHMNAASPPLRQHGKMKMSTPSEDFYVEVSPGAYSVSASLPGSLQHTQMVHLNAGETVSLKFKL